MYADDLVLLARSAGELQLMMDVITEYANGRFLIRRAKNGYLDNQKVSEKIQHMAEKLSLRYVETRGLF